MIFVFFLLAGGFAVFAFLSKDKYRQDLEGLDEKVFRLKSILPVGLFLIDGVKYRYTTTYDRRILTAVVETNGTKQAQFYLKVHWANKIVYMLMGLIFSAFVGAFSKLDAGYLIFSAGLLAGIFYFSDRELFERVKKRRAAIRIAFPDFANKLVLLINAGMTISRAWERIANDGRRDTPLQKEVCMAIQDIRSGKPEHTAYEDFAKRCRTPEITRFISVILQNMRKGNAELVPVLRVFTNDCWEMRKNIAKRYGEEASTKMILPLMLMFLAILLIVGTPAVLALRNI